MYIKEPEEETEYIVIIVSDSKLIGVTICIIENLLDLH
jgi:hypothetical protein